MKQKSQSMYKVKTFFKHNKNKVIIAIVTISIVSIIMVISSINENYNFKKDIALAQSYYEDKEFYKVSEIFDKYSHRHKNDEFIKKYNYIQYLLTDYRKTSLKTITEYEKILYLFRGYRNCLDKKTNNDWEKNLVDEAKDIYYSTLHSITSLNKNEIEKIAKLDNNSLEVKVKELARISEQSKTCEKSNIKIVKYSASSPYITVTLKNTNGCTWNIKSYSKIRVFFTDQSYEDVYLSNNINLEKNESYTFSDCYLGSNNKLKTVSGVTFID